MKLFSTLTRNRLSTLLALLLVCVVLLIFALYQFLKVNEVADKSEHAYDVISHSEKMIGLITLNENNLSYYITTFNQDYRFKYDATVRELFDEIRHLRQSEKGNSYENGILDSIEQKFKTHLEAERNLFRKVNVSNRLVLDSLFSKEDARFTAEIHGLIDKLQSYEGNLLVDQKVINKAERKRFLWGIVSGIILLNIVLFILFRKNQQELIEEQVQKARLEKEVIEKDTAIQATENELDETLQRITDGFLSMHLDGTCDYINASAAKVFGKRPDELVGKKLHNIYPYLRDYQIFKDFAEARDKQVPISGEQFDHVLDHWYVYHIYPSTEGASIFFRDITEFRKTQHQLREQDELYRLVVETAQEGIVITDAGFRITYLNKRMLEMANIRLEDVLGRSTMEMVYEEDRDSFVRQISERLKGGLGKYEVRISNNKGAYLWVTVNSVPRYRDNEFAGSFALVTDITESKQKEQALLESNQQLELAERMARLGSWQLDIINKNGIWSKEMYRLLGLEEANTPPAIDTYLSSIHPEDRSLVAEQMETMKKGEMPQIVIFRTNPERGPVKFLLPGFQVHRNEKGEVLSYSGTMLDITERVVNENQLKQSESKYRQLFESNPIPMTIMDVETLDMMHVNATALHSLGYTYEEFLKLKLIDLIDINQVPKIIHEVPTLPEGLSNAGIWKHRKKNGELVDVEIFSHSLVYNDRPCRLVMAIDVTERVRNARARAESEQRLRTIVDSNPYGILVINQQGMFLEANPTALHLLEVSDLKQLASQELITFFKAQSKELVYQLHEKALEGKMIDVEVELKGMKGGNKWVSLHGVPLMDTINDRVNVLCVTRDITSYKQAEKRIRDYQFALDQSAIIAMSNREGKIFYVNENFCRITEFSPDEIYGNDHRLFLPGNHFSGKELDVILTIQKGNVWRGEMQEVSKSGRPYWVDNTIIPFLNEEGEPFQYLSIRFDITQRKEAEARQQEILERYDRVSKATHDVIWDVDFQAQTIKFNDNFKLLFGFEDSDRLYDREWWNSRIHPEDLPRVTDTIREHISDQRPTIQMEYRFRNARNKYRYIVDRALVLYNDKGEAIRIIGAMQDVTMVRNQEKLIEKAIIQAQEKERQQIGMELHDNVNQILSASKLYLGMAEDLADNKDKFLQLSDTVRTYINSAITEIRKLSHQLAPSFFKDISLNEVIQSLMVNLEEAQPFKIHLSIDEKANRISKEIQVNIYRIIQEQLNNITKHANAANCWITISTDKDHVILSVQDDGQGFQPRKVKSGIGLENIKRRSKVFSGDFNLNSAPGKGCEIRVSIPLNAEMPD